MLLDTSGLLCFHHAAFLKELRLDTNQIGDISPLSQLALLRKLGLWDNQIRDISDLSQLTSLEVLYLDRNQISDISPLMDNGGLGKGDEVDLGNNPLGEEAISTHIPALQGRGVTVAYNAPEPTNHPPVADAGLDRSVQVGTLVTLDGRGSSDPDGDVLTYWWNENTSNPARVTLSDERTQMATFTPRVAGTYVFALVVDDGKTNNADEVTITVKEEHSRTTGERITVTLPGGATMEMVWIEPGTFMMGTREDQKQLLLNKRMWGDTFENELPAHSVTIAQGFYLGKFELTQGQWESVMGTRPWEGQTVDGEVYHREGPNYPAVYISWEDVRTLIAALNQAEGSAVYRLPTEAEREYACRAWMPTLWSFGDDARMLSWYAWYYDNAWNVGEKYAREVGTQLPNPWGLYDMHGNVSEWCQDWYDANYYSVSPSIDPPGPTTGSARVVRGGFCGSGFLATRSAYRDSYAPGIRGIGIGARLLRQSP